MNPSDRRPGFRRRILVLVRSGAVAAMLEDDIHCLAVTLRHAAGRVTAIEPQFVRAPWDTCPGAMAKLQETFVGRPLAEVTARLDKKANCTHLHDMAVLAAAHAGTPGEVQYDILATDPVAGARSLELWRDGALQLAWAEHDGILVAPDPVAGRTLMTLRDWIAGLPPGEREAARLLQWASLVAHGRTMPLEAQSDASALPPNCYSFQPERAARAVRNGLRRDFSDGSEVPLAGLREAVAAAL
jgi:hypothetical protein